MGHRSGATPALSGRLHQADPFPNRNYSVHIAAIDQRSNFRQGADAASIGIELGSDASADANLDDYLVFENSPFQSVAFFREMLFKHLLSVRDGSGPRNGNRFVRMAFTQEQAFEELVRASEGVPRDAINILQIAATRARDEKISVPHIRNAAKDWYERDKSTLVSTNPEAERLLNWIIEKVIGARKARAFMVRSDVQNDTLDRLFDERILHIARESVFNETGCQVSLQGPEVGLRMLRRPDQHRSAANRLPL